MMRVKGTRIFNGRAYRLFGKTPSFDGEGRPVGLIKQRQIAENSAQQIRKRNYNARVIHWAGGSGIFVAPRSYDIRLGRQKAIPVVDGKTRTPPYKTDGERTNSAREMQTRLIPDDAQVHYIHPRNKIHMQEVLENGIQPSDTINPQDAKNLRIPNDTKGTYATTAIDPKQVSQEAGVIGIISPIHHQDPIMTQDGDVIITGHIEPDQIVQFTRKDLEREGCRMYKVIGPEGKALFSARKLSDAKTYVSKMVNAVQQRGYHYTNERQRIPAHLFKLIVEEVIDPAGGPSC